MVNDAPPNWSPTNQDYNNYLLQRTYQGWANDHNQTKAEYYTRSINDPQGAGVFDNWYYWQYETRQDPATPPPVPQAEWVGTFWQDGMFINFTFVSVGLPLVELTEDDKGWTLNGKLYKKIVPARKGVRG
jgi:hypothetical protein